MTRYLFLLCTVVIIISAIVVGYFQYLFNDMLHQVELLKAFEVELKEINAADHWFLDVRIVTSWCLKIVAYLSAATFLILSLYAILKKSGKSFGKAMVTLIIGAGFFTYYHTLFFDSKMESFVDNNGVLYFYYGYGHENRAHIGFQRNPLFIASKALEYHADFKETGNEQSLMYFDNSKNWLVQHQTVEGNAIYFESDFPVLRYDIPAPFRCGLANSRVLKVFQVSHEVHQDSSMIELCRGILNSFAVNTAEGGTRVVLTDDAWWYCEYPKRDGSSPMVLNGMISILLALHEYHQYSQDSLAKELFDKGVNAVKLKLPEFDNNGNSFYDLQKLPASRDYHRLHIDLLQKLYDVSGEEIFIEYSRKWNELALTWD